MDQGVLGKGKVPFYQIFDTQAFVASVKILVCAVQSKWDDCVCLAHALGKEGTCESCSFLSLQLCCKALSSSLEMFVAKVLVKSDRNPMFLMVFQYLWEVRTCPLFLLWWKTSSSPVAVTQELLGVDGVAEI